MLGARAGISATVAVALIVAGMSAGEAPQRAQAAPVSTKAAPVSSSAVFVPPASADQKKVVDPAAPTSMWGAPAMKTATRGVHPNTAPVGTAVGAPGLGSLPWFSMNKINLSTDVAAQVNLGNGNLLLTASDGNLSGPGLTTRNDRFYNGLSTATGSYGGGWSSALSQVDFGLQVSGSTATFHGPSGLVATFTQSGTTWTAQSGFNATLTVNTASTSAHYVLAYNSSGEKLQFAASGYITADLNRNGVGSHYAYNTYGQVTTVTNDSGRQYTVTWSGQAAGSTIQSIQDSAGRQIQYQISSGQLVKVIKLDGNYENYVYDTSGRLSQAVFKGTRAGDMEVDFTYDTSSRVASLSQKETSTTTVLQSSTFAYTAGQTVVTDGNGHAATYLIDAQGRVTKATDALGHVRSNTWTANSDVATTTDALGAGSTPGNVTTYSYDQLNNASAASYPTGAAASATYAQGTACPGAGSGNPYLAKCTKDDAGNGKSLTYDTSGNLTQVSDSTSGGTGAVTQKNTYENAAHSVCGGFPGQVCSSTDGDGHVTSYTYNRSGDLTTVTPPSPLGVTTLTPDSLGRDQYVLDGNSQRTPFGYNDRDQVVQQSPESMGTYSHLYFANGLEDNEAWRGVSRLLYYDGAGRLTQKTGPNGQSEQYTYDKAGNVLTYTDASGTTTYGYDAANHLTSTTEPGGTCTAGTTIPAANSGCTKFGYNNNGAETSRTFPGGASVVTTRDLSGRATRITAKDAAGTTQADVGYSFTAAGGSGPTADRTNVQTSTAYLEQGVTPGAVTSYTYDSLSRVKTATEKVGATVTASWAYSYDGAGNRTQQVRAGATGATAGTIGYTYNAANEIASTTADTVAWGYDGDGAQLTNGITGQTQAVDNRGTVTNIGASVYTTFSPGNTEQLTRSTPSTTYTTSSLGLASETIGGTATTFSRTSASDVLSSSTGTSRNYFVKDALGSVIGIFDATGAWQGGYSYSPYGELRASATTTAATVNPVRYISGYLDTGSGLYKLGARYYDPSLGRFTQTDPSGQDANQFVYAGDSPITQSDPTGLSVFEDVLKVAGYVLDGRSLASAIEHSNPAELIGAATGTAFDVTCSIAVVDLSETVVGALIVAGLCLAISLTAENLATNAAG